ncbi:hypothetical protein T11_16729 [Trichinella zimbabwensis]|uniref:Uncharacterized protein n=1 Tax=Trichinella zimbabwensis TaxID=268475 RepID=A0A0V1H3R4_9BILA|nr:hypothetical protein T11_16729 [Trichinella zimbabwensis]
MEKIRRYFYPALMIRGSNVVNNLLYSLLKVNAQALPVYRENLSRPNRKRKQHLRCKRGLGKILVQRSTQTGQQGFCGMASPLTMLEHLACAAVSRPYNQHAEMASQHTPPPPPPPIEQFCAAANDRPIKIEIIWKTLNDRIGKRRGKILRVNLECKQAKHDEAKGA